MGTYDKGGHYVNDPSHVRAIWRERVVERSAMSWKERAEATESEVTALKAVIAAVETLCNTAIEHKDRVQKDRDTGPLERSAAIEAGHFASEVRAVLSTGMVNKEDLTDLPK